MPAKCYVTCKAAIWKGDKLFLQKEKACQDKTCLIFDLPGGRLDEGEDPRDALRREVMEEIGVELATVSEQPVKVWSTTGNIPVVGLLFEATFKSEDFDFTTGEEIEVLDTAYLSKEDFEPTPDHAHKNFILELYDQHRSQ